MIRASGRLQRLYRSITAQKRSITSESLLAPPFLRHHRLPLTIASLNRPIGLSLRSMTTTTPLLNASNSDSTAADYRFQSVYDPDATVDWKEWFSPVEYANPWEASSSLEPLDFPPADYATRHLIQLLQELYHQGQPASFDRVTTERCNHVLTSLLQQNDLQGRAARGDAILKTMELFDSWTTNNTNTTTSSSSSKLQQRRPFQIPKPSRETYNTVLKLYAKTGGTSSSNNHNEIPRRSQELVEKMEWRYRELGELDMKPFSFHWDQVLLAWKNNSNDWERAAHAASIFLKQRAVGQVDVSSYILVLSICAHKHVNEKAALLGANVAVKLWQSIMEQDDDGAATSEGGPTVKDLPSHFYAHFLQAIRSLPEGTMRETYFDACFKAASENGKVNVVVLNEFTVHARSPRLFGRWLGRYKDSVRGKSASEASKMFFAMIPGDWKARAD